MSRLRVGCVGTGFIAGRHLGALAGFPDVDIVAVADPVGGRAQGVAARHGATAYADGLALLETEHLDAVWLCVPPAAHGPLELAAVARGLPFFVEKPLAVDLPAAVRIAAAVRSAGLITCVGYHWRSLRLVEQAKRLIGDDPVHVVTGTWLDSTPAAPWWSRRGGSGGQLVEQTTHLFDLSRILVGEVASVQALEATTPRPDFPEADVPTASAVLMRFHSGAIGTMTSSCVLDRRHQVDLRLVLQGTTLELRERALSDHELRTESRDGEQASRSTEDPIATEDRAFVDAVLGRREQTPVSYDDALRTQALVCAADRSAQEGGRVVDVQDELAQALEAQDVRTSSG